MVQTKARSRRAFLKRTVAGCASVFTLEPTLAARGVLPNRLGYSTISWPETEFEHALETISALGFRGVQLVGWARELYESRLGTLRDRLGALDLAPVAQSCWGVTLDPVNSSDNTSIFSAYAEFLKDLGGSILQVTDSGEPDAPYSDSNIRRLGLSMNELGRVAQEHGLTLGYHPHLGSFGETEEGVARILAATDANLVKLIADTGHLALGGMDPAEIIRTYQARLALIHLKDVREDAYAASRASRAALLDRKYLFCEIGKGVLDFAAVAHALREAQYTGWLIVELDGNEPAPGGPDEGARSNRDALISLGWLDLLQPRGVV